MIDIAVGKIFQCFQRRYTRYKIRRPIVIRDAEFFDKVCNFEMINSNS